MRPLPRRPAQGARHLQKDAGGVRPLAQDAHGLVRGEVTLILGGGVSRPVWGVFVKLGVFFY